MEAQTPSDDFEVESSTAAAVPQPVAPAPVEEPTHELAADPGDEDPEPQSTAPADTDTSEAGKKLAAKKGSLQSRIDAITREKYDTQRERDEARAQLAQIHRELEQLRAAQRDPKTAAAPTRAAEATGKPSEDEIGTKYQSYGEYVEALADWKSDQKIAALRNEMQERSQRAAVAQRHDEYTQTFVQRIEAAEKTDPEFWSKMSPAVVNLRPSSALHPGERPTAMNAIADVIFTSEYATDLMRHFSANDRDLQRLSTLPPNALYREMGRLEARYHRPSAASTSGPAHATPSVSQAAPPIKPVGSTASAGERDPLADDLDIDEHILVMNAREQKRARR